MFGADGWTVGHVGGVEIRIHPSWSFIAFLIAYTFYLILSATFPENSTGILISVAVIMAALFFLSVLLHELAHSWKARSRGVDVRGITLFLFGGATHADLETENPTDELVISTVGPVTSVMAAAAFWGVSVAAGPGLVGFAAGRLGWINLALAVFNLVPGFPLDGGRILRSIVWRSTGSLERATRVAARAGQGVGYVLMAIGILEILALGALIGGLWLVAIGWFLSQTAQASLLQMQAKRMLADVSAGRVMARDLKEMPVSISVQDAVDDYFMLHDFNAYPVRDGNEVIGLATLAAVRRIPREEWPHRSVGDVVTPLSDACVVDRSMPMDEVLEKLTSNDANRVMVSDGDEIVGIITSRDLARWLQRSEELGLADG